MTLLFCLFVLNLPSCVHQLVKDFESHGWSADCEAGCKSCSKVLSEVGTAWTGACRVLCEARRMNVVT